MTGAPSILLTILVGGIAFLYASVGFGGATGYLAVMSQFGIEPNLMATTALLLNVVVAGISFTNYARAGHMEQRLLLSFPLASIPAAFLGGYFKLNEDLYFVLLYSVLTYVMVRMLFTRNEKTSEARCNASTAILVGAAERSRDRVALRDGRDRGRNHPVATDHPDALGNAQTGGLDRSGIHLSQFTQRIAGSFSRGKSDVRGIGRLAAAGWNHWVRWPVLILGARRVFRPVDAAGVGGGVADRGGQVLGGVFGLDLNTLKLSLSRYILVNLAKIRRIFIKDRKRLFSFSFQCLQNQFLIRLNTLKD